MAAVVIVIAVVVVAIMGGFTGIGGGADKKTSDYMLTTGEVAIDNIMEKSVKGASM